MSALGAVVEQFIIGQIISNGAPATGKNKLGLGLFALSGFLILLGTGFLIYGMNLWLRTNYSADLAALLTGASTFALAALLGLLGFGIIYWKKYRLKKLKDEIEKLFFDMIDFFDNELSEPVKDNPKTAVLIASLAGFFAGDRLL